MDAEHDEHGESEEDHRDSETNIIIDAEPNHALPDQDAADQDAYVPEKILDELALTIDAVAFHDGGQERVNARHDHVAGKDFDDSGEVDEEKLPTAVERELETGVSEPNGEDAGHKRFECRRFEFPADQEDSPDAEKSRYAGQSTNIGSGIAVFLEPELAEIRPEPGGNTEKSQHE